MAHWSTMAQYKWPIVRHCVIGGRHAKCPQIHLECRLSRLHFPPGATHALYIRLESGQESRLDYGEGQRRRCGRVARAATSDLRTGGRPVYSRPRAQLFPEQCTESTPVEGPAASTQRHTIQRRTKHAALSDFHRPTTAKHITGSQNGMFYCTYMHTCQSNMHHKLQEET